MDIITERKKNGRLEDGINTILSLSEEQFNNVIQKLIPRGKTLENIRFYYTTDSCELPNNEIYFGLEPEGSTRGYFGGEFFLVSQIFQYIAKKMEIVSKDTEEYERLKQLISTRDLEAFKAMYKNNGADNPEIIDRVFDILSDRETFDKFLDYANNQEHFSIAGKQIDIGEYLQYLGEFFGNKDENGNINNQMPILKDFYIPDLELYKQRYLELFSRVNIDRYVNPTYEFKRFTSLEYFNDKVIRKFDEPEWKINPQLQKEVYDNKPDGLSLEEEAMFIYCKLCHLFLYDEGYFYRDKTKDEKYKADFSKEHLENIKPKAKITCWDFARIFSKFINKIDGDIEGVVISQGSRQGHFLSGFYTDKVSVMLEPIDGVNNDLMRIKNGIGIGGFKIISDREGLIQKALDKIYPILFGRSQRCLAEYLQTLRSIPRTNLPNSIEQKIYAFIEIMKETGITGNELVQTFTTFNDCGFFEEKIESSYVGAKEESGGRKSYNRNILLRLNTEFQNKGRDCKLYLLDTSSLNLNICSMQQIEDKMNSGELIYENQERKMRGIEVGENL